MLVPLNSSSFRLTKVDVWCRIVQLFEFFLAETIMRGEDRFAFHVS